MFRKFWVHFLSYQKTAQLMKEAQVLTPTAVGENRGFPKISSFHIGMGSGFFVGFLGNMLITLFQESMDVHGRPRLYISFIPDPLLGHRITLF